MTKKSMVLSSVKDDEKKAVLSMEFDNGNLTGRLRLYNFSSEPLGIMSLGLTGDNGVIKAGLTKEGNMLFKFGTTVKSMPENFSCAIINFVGGQPSPILYGSSQGFGDLEKTLGEVVSSLKNTSNVEQVEEVLDMYGVDYDEQVKEEINEEIEKNFTIQQEQERDCEYKDCQTCPYKKFFFEHNEVSNLSTNSPSPEEFKSEQEIEEVENQEELSFFNDIKNQVETLFSQNKPEDFLEKAIPSSKWVKVDFDDGGDYYVFGLIYEDEVLKYVCYGVPAIYSSQAPKQLSGFPVWFPLDKEKREGFGYWLSYQDANTGESIKAIVE